MVDTKDIRWTIHDGRRTTPGVWRKLPTGELTTDILKHNFLTYAKAAADNRNYNNINSLLCKLNALNLKLV